MADRRVTEDTTITAAATAAGDWFDLVDVSDTTDAPSGTNKKIAASEVATLVGGLLNLASVYQPLDSDLTAIAALATTTFGRSLLTMADAAALRTSAGLVIGTDVQPADSDLTAIAALSTTTFGRALLTQADAAATRTTIGAAATTDLAAYLPLLAGGAAVENLGAVEFNVRTETGVSGAKTLDTSIYDVFDETMSGAATFTFSNPAPSGKATTFVLILRGAFTPTFPAAVRWADATAPSYATPSIYTFTTVDAGANWYGTSAGKAYA